MTATRVEELDAVELAEAAPRAAAAAPWLLRYQRALVGVDLLMVLSASVIALLVRFGTEGATLRGISYELVTLLLPVAWFAALALSRCYEARFVGAGPEELRRVFDASVRLAAVIVLVAFATKVELSRVYIAIAIPLGLALLMLGRLAGRGWLRRQRRAGRCSHRVLLLGTYAHVHELAMRLRREPLAGLQVVGACVPGGVPKLPAGQQSALPIFGSLASVHEALVASGADTVAVTASPGLQGEPLQRLAYDLEGTGVDLLVAPALTNVTGSRISIRPAAGLPLLHLDEPELSGVRTLIKGAFDRTSALLGLLLLLPLLCGIALAIRFTDDGPALFKQTRVGRGGQEFCVWKFRSMHVDAEARLAELQDRNEHDGVLFKVRDDPRVTRIGKLLRKYSLDELPQLWNVLRGDMSLVGPRPPLPSEVARYSGHTHRRLLVKPGITGLWQVSGRSDLSWEDTVRLDLQYVENWSLGLDLSILARTVATVVKGSGAY